MTRAQGTDTNPHFPGPPRQDTGPVDIAPVPPEIDGMSQWAYGRVGVVHVGPPARRRAVPRWALAVGAAMSAVGLALYVWR